MFSGMAFEVNFTISCIIGLINVLACCTCAIFVPPGRYFGVGGFFDTAICSALVLCAMAFLTTQATLREAQVKVSRLISYFTASTTCYGSSRKM